MPYSKRRGKRRSARRIPVGPRGYLDTAAQALTVAYAVKRLINVEYHRISTSFPAAPNTTGSTTNLTAIAQGDDVSNRQGNKIRMKQLLLSGNVRLHASATDSNVRMVIVRDNNGSTTIPTITDLYGSAANFFQNLLKEGNPQQNSRFTVLWDKYVFVNSDTPNKPVAYSMALDHHCFFSGTAATDEGKGALYLFQASNESTNDPVVNILAQTVWIDN